VHSKAHEMASLV